MVASRRTTINHMFAAAVAPHDAHDEARLSEALLQLGNDPDADLLCGYCGQSAETWDHIFATVRDSRFSGFGHRLGNLLPCCKPCNSRKGNKSWQAHLESLRMPEPERIKRAELISNHINLYGLKEPEVSSTALHQRLDGIRLQILQLMEEADEIAAQLR
jgi:hypothetical protein